MSQLPTLRIFAMKLRRLTWCRSTSFAFVAFCITTLLCLLPKSRSPPLETYQYFTEVSFNARSKQIGSGDKCDTRFAPPQGLSINETRRTLVSLLASYVITMQSLGYITWIAHGALIGYHWNQRLLPWDTDIDVQMSIETMSKLARLHNMTEFSYFSKESGAARRYLLDINPHYNITSTQDTANIISGRWIDTANGKYLDITTVYHGSESDLFLYCKDGHRVRKEDLFPLTEVWLEGIQVLVPWNFQKLIIEEYGLSALKNPQHHW